MEVAAALERLGGVGTSDAIISLTSRKRLRSAVNRGEVQRVRRGCYQLRGPVDRAQTEALRLGGVLSHLSAAEYYGWPIKSSPDRTWVTVARGRHVSLDDRATVNVVYADRSAIDLGRVTSPLRTVIDCARRMPFDEALAVADSALRCGDVTKVELVESASAARGKGAASARRVAGVASAQAANPYESVLRAIVLEFPDLQCEPQAAVVAGGRVWHPDLVDRTRRVVIEADSFTFHTTREAHARDCVRYNALTLAGWLVLRFTWEHVMLSPAYVRGVLTTLVGGLDCTKRECRSLRPRVKARVG